MVLVATFEIWHRRIRVSVTNIILPKTKIGETKQTSGAYISISNFAP